LRSLPKLLQRDDARRPTPNPPLPGNFLTYMMQEFDLIKLMLESHAANIRPLDRTRLNGIGIKKQGFVDRAYSQAVENDNLMPKYLTIEKFSEDFEYFNRLRSIFELLNQLREFLWNLVIQAADVTYTDALEFYASVREAAQRRIDGAESVHRDLEPFFRRAHSETEDEPTESEVEKDVRALLHDKRDGKVVIENVKPKVTGGVHEVVDEKFAGSAEFKETDEGKIKE
jgi:hypothetical protein